MTASERLKSEAAEKEEVHDHLEADRSGDSR